MLELQSLIHLIEFLDFSDPILGLPSFFNIALVPYLYSIDKAIEAGMLSCILLWALGRAHLAGRRCCCGDADELAAEAAAAVPQLPGAAGNNFRQPPFAACGQKVLPSEEFRKPQA